MSTGGEPIVEQPPPSTPERNTQEVFDPVNEWKRIEDTVALEITEGRTSGNFDDKIKLRNRLISELAKKFVPTVVETERELFERLRAVDRANWGLEEIQRLNSQLHPEFYIHELIDLRTLAELIGVGNYYHSKMSYWKKEGLINKTWVAIDTVDAVCVTSGLLALAKKEGIQLGKKVVDLGGGDGTWGFVLWKLGFNVTLIERDPTLIQQLQFEKGKLEKILEVKIWPLQTINGEFSTDDAKNTPQIRMALRKADVMVSYPWPNEVLDRMKLFSQYGKNNALLVMYGGSPNGFSTNTGDITNCGLEVVGSEINEKLKSSGGELQWVRGYPAPQSGVSWVVLRKATTSDR